MKYIDNKKRIVTLLMVTIFIAGSFCPLPVLSQAEPVTVTITVNELDDRQQLYAEQYLEDLEQLGDILKHYGKYFSKLDISTLNEYQITFEIFANSLEQNRYSKNPANLQKDLANYDRYLTALNDRLKNSSNRKNKSLARRVRSLKRELSILSDLVEENLSNRKADQAFEISMQSFVAEQLEANEIKIIRLNRDAFAKQYERAMEQFLITLKQLSEDNRSVILDSLQNMEVLREFRLKEDWDKLIDLDLVQMEAVIKGLEAFEIKYTHAGEPIIVYHEFVPPEAGLPPSTPTPPDYRDLPNIVIAPEAPGFTKQESKHLSGSLGISSYQMPIYITQPVGKLTIIGWDDNMVSAKLSLLIEADTDRDRKEFLAGVKLDIGQGKGGYYVEVIFPRLTNPNTRVISSDLIIMTPSKNRIICDHSFGELSAELLNGGALIKGNNSNMAISAVNGKLKIENSLGEVAVDQVSGNLTIYNSSGKIFVTNCSGRTNLNNSSGLVSVADSEGQLTIVNSGPVNVVDHEGDVDTENRNGSITLLNINGDVVAYGSQQPIKVQNIIGNVTLENRNAEIRAFQISKTLEATTTHAEMVVGSVEGSLKLEGKHSDIYIDIEVGLNGISKVVSTSGKIHLSLAPEANLLLSAITVDGSIGSSFPTEIVDKGEVRSCLLKLGKGSPKLTIKGSHSDIIIREL